MKFNTQYDNANLNVHSSTGDGYEFTYKQEYDKKGICELIVQGKTCLYDKIQSFAEDTDIYKILSKYFGGDISVLDKNKGFYADVADIPSNFNDFHNKIVEGQNIWNGLPVDFKSLFNNDLNQFVSSIYDKSFDDIYKSYSESKQPIKAPVPEVPVKVVESKQPINAPVPEVPVKVVESKKDGE